MKHTTWYHLSQSKRHTGITLQSFVLRQRPTAQVCHLSKRSTTRYNLQEHLSVPESDYCQRSDYHSSVKEGKSRQVAKQLLTDAYIAEEKALLETQIEQVRQASISSKHSVAWKVVNYISGRNETKQAMLSDDRNNAWLNHFSSLLGKPPSIPDTEFTISRVVEGTLPISTTEFSTVELEDALFQSKPGGALGLDNIPLELWKSRCLQTAPATSV